MLKERGDIAKIIVFAALLAGGVYFLSYLRRLGSEIAPPVVTPTPSSVVVISPPSFLISGPGGCRGIEECARYCAANPAECFVPEVTPTPSSVVPSGRPVSPRPSPIVSSSPSVALPTRIPLLLLPVLLPSSVPTQQSPLPDGPTPEEEAALSQFFATFNWSQPIEISGLTCNTPRSCQAFCSENRSVCERWFSEKLLSGEAAVPFSGRGGP